MVKLMHAKGKWCVSTVGSVWYAIHGWNINRF